MHLTNLIFLVRSISYGTSFFALQLMALAINQSGKMQPINVAKCNLGKVKIEPMLVAGCVLWGQRITPKRMCYDAGWSQGFSRLPLAGVAHCLHICKSLDCADRCRSLAVAYTSLYRQVAALLRILSDSS